MPRGQGSRGSGPSSQCEAVFTSQNALRYVLRGNLGGELSHLARFITSAYNILGALKMKVNVDLAEGKGNNTPCHTRYTVHEYENSHNRITLGRRCNAILIAIIIL